MKDCIVTHLNLQVYGEINYISICKRKYFISCSLAQCIDYVRWFRYIQQHFMNDENLMAIHIKYYINGGCVTQQLYIQFQIFSLLQSLCLPS